MKPHNRASAPQRRRGLTLIEVIVCVVLAGLAAALVVGAAQPRTQKEANIARCANNLRLLAAAAHCYADDFKEKFFYNWESALWITGKIEPQRRKAWYDRDRVGSYLVGTLMYAGAGAKGTVKDEGLTEEHRKLLNQQVELGLGDGPFVCPESLRDSRSYHQNFWASGIEIPGKVGPGYTMGAFFDRTATGVTSKLMLFGEMIATQPTTKKTKVTVGEFGRSGLPGERFGGPRQPGEFPWNEVSFPLKGEHPTQLDYVRHGENTDPRKAEGSVNFAYFDGHVRRRRHTDLFDSETHRSTYDTLWSLRDFALEEYKEPE